MLLHPFGAINPCQTCPMLTPNSTKSSATYQQQYQYDSDLKLETKEKEKELKDNFSSSQCQQKSSYLYQHNYHHYSVCPNDQQNYEVYDERYNARYPCQAGIISGRLACGLAIAEHNQPQPHPASLLQPSSISSAASSLPSPRSHFQQSFSKNNHDQRGSAMRRPVERPATTVTLTVLTSATLSYIPTHISTSISATPTLSPPSISAATAVESMVTAVAGTTSSSSTSILHSIMASLMAKASSFNTARLLEPDLFLAVSIGLSVPCLALVMILLGVLLWREWEIRKAEEIVAKNYVVDTRDKIVNYNHSSLIH